LHPEFLLHFLEQLEDSVGKTQSWHSQYNKVVRVHFMSFQLVPVQASV
jgi:hypothetical protein